jgi:hypothetical protein
MIVDQFVRAKDYIVHLIHHVLDGSRSHVKENCGSNLM